MGANNSRYRIWYELKNSAFQYDQRMVKYPFHVRFLLTVFYKTVIYSISQKLMLTALAVNTRWVTIFL